MMPHLTYRANGQKITKLMWLMAAIGVFAGAVQLVGVRVLLSRFERHQLASEEARRTATQSVESLRAYRRMLVGDVVGQPQSLVRPSKSDEFSPARLEPLVDSARTALLTLAEYDASQAEVATRQLGVLADHFSRMHTTLQTGRQHADRLAKATFDRDAMASQARTELSQLLLLLDKAEGALRLQLALHINDLQHDAVPVDRGHPNLMRELASALKAGYYTTQLRSTISDLAVGMERVVSCRSVDELVDLKDNVIRQDLSRMRQDSVRSVTGSSDSVAERIDNVQTILMGEGSIDDEHHQTFRTGTGGLFPLQLEVLSARSAQAESTSLLKAQSEECLRSQLDVIRAVNELHRAAALSNMAMLQGSSRSLSYLAAIAVSIFVAAVFRIQGHVKLSIRHSEETYQEAAEMAKVVAESPNEVYIFRQDSLQFVVVNDGACEATGFSRADLLLKTPLDVMPQLGLEQYRQRLAPLVTGETPLLKYQSEHRRKGGEHYPVEVTVNQAVYHHEPVFVAFVHDLTDIKRLECQLAHAQKLESVGQLAAGIAHEINTPIQYVGDNNRFLQDAFGEVLGVLDRVQTLVEASHAGAIGAAELHDLESACQVADVAYLVAEIPQAIEQSLDGVERVGKIVRAMKEFSHPGAGQKVMVDLRHAVETTLIVAKNEWKYVADVVTEYDSELPAVACLPGDMNQVLLNLIVNAAHAIGEARVSSDAPKGTITVRTRRDGNWAVVTVEDTGVGIPDSIRTRVFDPFFTTKEVGKGTGQGLAIARSVVVDKHSGTIECESQVGRGTTFTVRIPFEAPAATANECTTLAGTVALP